MLSRQYYQKKDWFSDTYRILTGITLDNDLLLIKNKASSARSASDEALVVQTGSEVCIYYGDCIEKKLACVKSQ
jgi:hypothetical protein